MAFPGVLGADGLIEATSNSCPKAKSDGRRTSAAVRITFTFTRLPRFLALGAEVAAGQGRFGAIHRGENLWKVVPDDRPLKSAVVYEKAHPVDYPSRH